MTALIAVGDFTGEGKPDLLARNPSGQLLLYKGNGTGGFASGSGGVINSGWNIMTSIISGADFTGDGSTDLVACDSSGILWVYPHTASGFGTRRQLGGGWNIMSKIITVIERPALASRSIMRAVASPNPRRLSRPVNGSTEAAVL